MLEYFHYGSEGTAYVRVDAVVYLIDSLEWAEYFSGIKRGEPEPGRQQWWIKIGDNQPDRSGWLEVKPSVVRAKLSGP